MKKYVNVTGAFLIILMLFAINGFAQEKNKKPPKKKNPNRNEQKHQPRTAEEVARELGEDWENIVLEKIKTEDPDEVQALQQEKLKNPARYEEKLARLWNNYRRLEKLKQEDPEKYSNLKNQMNLDRLCRKLVQEYRRSNDGTRKSAIKTELKNHLTGLFALREAERARKVIELEQEVEKLKEMLEFRKKNKERIIAKRLQEMLGENEFLEW